jgi:hypothetical protein
MLFFVTCQPGSSAAPEAGDAGEAVGTTSSVMRFEMRDAYDQPFHGLPA